MRFFLIFILISLKAVGLNAQKDINISLKTELDNMLILDQKYRKTLSISMQGKADSLAAVYGVEKNDLNDYLWKLQSEIDSLNTSRIEEIIKTHGYPGLSLVGPATNEVGFYIIQHSKVIDKYLPVIEKAAKEKELRFELYAMMLDRSLMFGDKEQIYGTQGTGFSVKNPTTGKWERLSLIWPIKEPQTVNAKRKAAGFGETVEENAKTLGIEYKVFTLEEVLRMRNEITQAAEN